MNVRETNFLQSSAWADFHRQLKQEVIEKETKKYRYVAIVEKGQVAKRLYCPLGPVIKDKEKKRKLDFVRVEPTLPDLTTDDLEQLGLIKSSRDVQPPHTVVNDVSVDNTDIEAQLSQTARRYARKCDKAGITYSVSYEPTDIRHFIKLIHEVADRTGMHPYDDLYFQQIAVIAAIIFYTDGHTMMYTHAANSTEYRKYSPATGLALYSLKFAHEQGCKVYDWCGVAPEHDDGNPRWKSWAGFTHFKLSFGGQRIDRLGTWELPINKRRYRIYRLLLALARR